MSIGKRVAQIRKRSFARIKRWRDELKAKIAGEQKKRHTRIAKAKAGEEFRMFDSITLDAIPKDAKAVAGYVNGSWATYPEIVKRWPKAKHLSIAVSSSVDARCLDVEPGDATPADAPGWIKRHRGRTPIVYSSLSQAQDVVNVLGEAGLKQGRDYRLWVAHYTDKPHRCDAKCGLGFHGKADATQFTCNSGGKNLDESLCAPHFLD